MAVDNADLSLVLHYLFEDTGIDFEIGDDKIYLFEKIPQKEDKQPAPKEKIRVSGYIMDELGNGIVGGNILEKGTINGVATDWSGEYDIEVAADAVLVVSYIGHITQEVPVRGQLNLNIKLKEDLQLLNEVVVTALGIKKREESLTYAVQKLDGLSFATVKGGNLINNLSGKVSNVQINRNSSGLGASSRVIIRGNRSTSKNNQPLYVLDGVPILNTSSEQAHTIIGGTANAGNRDGGDGISNLNPEDIESITILKGASASALYGSFAANGVILITSKKGVKGVRRVSFSSELIVDQPVVLPEFQNSYSYRESAFDSWGDKSSLPVYDNVNEFFNLGVTNVNSLVFTTGTEKSQTYFSYANTRTDGIVEHSKLNKHNLNFREAVGFFDNRLTIDANIDFILQDIKNKPVSGGYYMNPLVGLYTFPRGMDIKEYKDNFEIRDENRNMGVQNWYNQALVSNGFEQNPYWLTNRVQSSDKRSRAIVLLLANLKITDWLKIQARGSADYIFDKFRQKIYASTSVSLAGDNGRYIDYSFSQMLAYGDVMLEFERKYDNFYIQGDIGASIRHINTDRLRYDSKTASLYYPNVFSIANIRMTSNAYIDEEIYREQDQSVFASFQAGYRDMFYIDATARNGWSSTLAYTKSKNKGFFFPSVGVSWVASNTFDMAPFVSFGKLRASWSKVGNALTPTISNPQSKVMAGGVSLEAHASSYEDLKPEMSTSIEVGGDWRFFNHRLYADLTLYKTNTRNQLFRLSTTPGGSIYKDYNVNSGNVQNKGIELTLGGTPVLNHDFKWETVMNYSANRNVVLELHDELTEFTYGTDGLTTSYSMLLRKGDSFGDIYGRAFSRDENGEIIYDADGLPITKGSTNDNKVGNCNPDFIIGWGNTFTYRNLSLYFLLDGYFGGKVLSQTQAELDLRGVSKATGDARNRGYVELEGTKIYDVERFYERVGGRNGITEYYMYDATNIRLREISLGYSLSDKLFEKTKYLSGIKFTLSARNLFFLYRKAPFDPDAVLSSFNDNQGVDVFGMPMCRTMSFSMRFVF
ncbi:SusC/RagA family TonB-linked outer membrane protein [Paludibacter sp. 221]|uniref:SusC/RagA family TonB-linked outer membrane protein n=1 Tax=Paludibacter sp. 221 TaxID=2302939 RepID=UPI001EF3170E|nr:SusC/RagA family TonB-linked outer membrane protein [Paludibacter sp. 221]